MVYLYGAGGHAKVVIEILEQAGSTIAGLFDSYINKPDLLGYTVTPELPAQLDA
jgi:acetyltransferase EpsM